jgi:hypothetical protein
MDVQMAIYKDGVEWTDDGRSPRSKDTTEHVPYFRLDATRPPQKHASPRGSLSSSCALLCLHHFTHAAYISNRSHTASAGHCSRTVTIRHRHESATSDCLFESETLSKAAKDVDARRARVRRRPPLALTTRRTRWRSRARDRRRANTCRRSYTCDIACK